MDLSTCRYGHPSHPISGITSDKDGKEIRRYGHLDLEWDDFHAHWNAVQGQESFYWRECGVSCKKWTVFALFCFVYKIGFPFNYVYMNKSKHSNDHRCVIL